LAKNKRKLRFDYAVMIIGIIISVAVVASAISLFEGYKRTLKSILLDCNSHVIIYPENSKPLAENSFNIVTLLLQNRKEIRSIQPVFTSTAISQADGKIKSCLVRAYPNNKESKWYFRYVFKGNPILTKGSMLVGENLLKDLAVNVGDSISLLYPITQGLTTLGAIPVRQSFMIGGVIRTGYYELDKALVIMTEKDAFSFYNISPQHTYIEIMLHDNYVNNAEELAKDFSIKLGNYYYVRSWIDFNGNLFPLINMEKWLIFLVFSFLILISSLNCVSIVSATIIESKREIAILRTIGMNIKNISQIVFLRIFTVCCLSIIIGMLLGTFIAWVITEQSLYQLKGDVYFINKINMQVSTLNYVVLFLLSMVIVSICIKIPLKLINKLEIVEILRGR
jgi:lipoprotein-releasing system permease protein